MSTIDTSEERPSNTTSNKAKLGPKIIKDLRDAFNSDITRTYEWRIKQLTQLKKMLLENEEKVYFIN